MDPNPMERPKVVERGLVRFTEERVETVRDGPRVTAVARGRTNRVRVRNASASEHPLRDLFWACGFASGAAPSGASASHSDNRQAWMVTVVFGVAAVLFFRHLASRITVVELRGDDGRVRMDLEERLTKAEVDRLNQCLAQELGWPVR